MAKQKAIHLYQKGHPDDASQVVVVIPDPAKQGDTLMFITRWYQWDERKLSGNRIGYFEDLDGNMQDFDKIIGWTHADMLPLLLPYLD